METSLTTQQTSKAIGLSKMQEQLLELYCKGMNYSNDFVVGMAKEIKGMNAIELRKTISALSETR